MFEERYLFMNMRYRYFLVITLFVLVVSSCVNDMAVVNKIIDPKEEPDLVADNIELLYSDSALLQMRLKAPVIRQYTEAEEPRREFPEGMHVWLFDKTGELKAEITANWAFHDMATNKWEARSNVVLTNIEGDKMETEQMFWEHEKQEVYSEKYTKITFANGNIASGESFWGLQDLSVRKLFNKSGIGKTTLFFKEEELTPENEP